jgi:hypothetical protein
MPTTLNEPLFINQVGEQFNLTISNTIVSLTVPAGAMYASVQVETNSIRNTERPGGTTITTSVGELVSAGQTLYSYTPSLVRLIRNGSTDSTVNVKFFN